MLELVQAYTRTLYEILCAYQVGLTATGSLAHGGCPGKVNISDCNDTVRQ
jgi:hypothetical protein